MSVFPQSVPTAPEAHAAPAPAALDPGSAPGAPSPYVGAPAGARVFRGRSLDELLPQIRAALGPDAVVLRRREGLQGGALGFFQTRFVEVEAVAGASGGAAAPGAPPTDAASSGAGVPAATAIPAAPRFDAYDAGDAWPEDVPDDGVRWLDDAVAARSAPGRHDAAAVASPWGATADGIAPIDGAAFLRHLDAAVERRRAEEPDPRPDAAAAPAVDDQRAAPGGDADPAPTVRAQPGATPRSGLLHRTDLGAAPDDDEPVRPFAGLGRSVAPWQPARADDGTLPVRATHGAGLTTTAVLTAPGAGEVRAVAGPASGRLELRDDEPVTTAARPSRLEVREHEPTVASARPVRLEIDDLEPAVAPAAVAPRRTPAPRAAAGPLGGFDAIAAPTRRGVDQDVAEYGLIARGLSPAIARSVVREAAAHGRPVDPGHRMDRATRAALARRIPRPGPRDDVRTIAVVGGPGAGRTSAAAALAVAHARAGRTVIVVALGTGDGGAALATAVLGSDVELLVAGTGAAAAAALRTVEADLCVVDTPAVHPSDQDAVAGLAAELRALGADETLLAVPGDHATAAVHDVADGLAGLDADALLMTHRDRTERPGGIVGASIVRGLPIAYVTDGRAIALADSARLARMVQP